MESNGCWITGRNTKCDVQVIITYVCFVIFLVEDISIDFTSGTKGNIIRWTKVKNATEYLVRIFVKDVKNPVRRLGDGNSTTVEISHSTLDYETDKSLPDPVTVNVTILAISENEIIGTERLVIGKCFYIKN